MNDADRTTAMKCRPRPEVVDSRRVSTTALARFLGTSRKTVTLLRRRGVLRQTAPGKYDLAEAVQAYAEWVAHGRQTAAHAGARHRTEVERSRKLRLANDDLEARLLPAQQVAALADELGRAVAEAVEPIPERVTADIAATENPAVIRRRLRDEVRQARRDIADRLTRLAGRRRAGDIN